MSPRGNWLALIVFATLVVAGTLCHEPWRDEADAWLLARDHSPAGLFYWTRYVGSPGLWYLVQMPFAQAGLPYQTQGLLNSAIAIATAALVLWRLPLPDLTKRLVIFSYLPAYEYGVIARSYGLSLLLLAALAALVARRGERPLLFAALVALLAQTNPHSLVLAACLTGLLLWEGRTGLRRRDIRWGLVLASAGCVLALVQLVPRPGVPLAPDTPEFSRACRTAVTVWQNAIVPAGDLGAPWPVLGLTLHLATALALIWSLRRSPALALCSAAMLTGITMFLAVVYYGGVRHAGFLFMTMLLCAVAAPRAPSARTARVLFSFALASSLPLTARAYLDDYRHEFSGAKNMAAYLLSEGLTTETVAAYPFTKTTSVLPYLPQRRFWYPEIEEFGSHMRWDLPTTGALGQPIGEILDRIERAFPPDRPLLLLMNEPLPESALPPYQLLFHNDRKDVLLQREIFWLYRRGEKRRPGDTPRARPAPGLPPFGTRGIIPACGTRRASGAPSSS
jgi:hypothetical protein